VGAPAFVGAALTPGSSYFDSGALSAGEPPVPLSFVWAGAELRVCEIMRSWRSTRNDRGDDYLARHWYEIRISDDRRAVIYFDRHARARQPRWWLYTIAAPDDP
jgi:hypothetical protein